jgi:hypothetical protein
MPSRRLGPGRLVRCGTCWMINIVTQIAARLIKVPMANPR